MKWEYRFYARGKIDPPLHQGALNALGELGWELIAVQTDHAVGVNMFWFRRPLTLRRRLHAWLSAEVSSGVRIISGSIASAGGPT